MVKYADDVEGDCWYATGSAGRPLDWQDDRPESTLLIGTITASLLSHRISNESSIVFVVSPRLSAVVDVDICSIFFVCNLPQLSSEISNESSILFACSSEFWVV